MNALEIKNLNKSYKEFNLTDINLTLPAGSIMGFVGENGAGKSTTIKLILDLITGDSGEITVLGASNQTKFKATKENIGVVLDEANFPDGISIKGVNGIMKRIYRHWDQEQFAFYVDKFALSPKKTIKEYSRGMKMKLSIAVALSHHPQLLILDEATSGLDPIVRDEILDVFLDFIQDENHSIFMSSHITSDLEKICDYIAFLHKGKLVFCEEKDVLNQKYGILKCSQNALLADIPKNAIKGFRAGSYGAEALVLRQMIKGDFVIDNATIEDIMVYLARGVK